MTITRLWETGLELNQLLLEFGSVVNAAQVTVSTTVARTGTYSLRITDDGSSYAIYSFPASLTQCRTSFHFQHTNLVNSTNDPRIFTLRATGTITVSIGWNGASFIAYVGGTAVATVAYSPFAAFDTWFHISVDVKIAAAGWIRLYVDGVQVIAFAGDTDNGAVNFNNACYGQTDGDSWLNGSLTYYDDIYIDDTTGEVAASLAPDSRFELITPNGNGDYAQWSGSDGNSTDNYLLVDDIPHDSDTTYIQTDVVTEMDAVNMTTFTVPSGWSVVAVIPLAVAKKDNALGTLDLQLFTRIGSTDQLSGDKVLPTDYAIIRDRHTSIPGGGAWTQSDVSAVEIGVKAV